MIEAEDRAAAARERLPRVIGDVRGERAGPTLIVVGGMHANEPAGIGAAERAHASIDSGRIRLNVGRFVSLRGNLAALALDATEPWLRARYIDEDLNRAFRDEPTMTTSQFSAEQRERRELCDVLASVAGESEGGTYLLDLHTVSSDSPAFIAIEDSLPTRRFADHFPLPKVLGMEEEVTGLLMDYATNALGCVACVVEAGRHDDPRSTDVHEAIVLLALAALGMTDPLPTTSEGEPAVDVVAYAAAGRERVVYDVRERVPVGDPSFKMQPGATAFTRVVAGRTIVAVEASEAVPVGATGLLFMPNRQTMPRVGDDAFFVVVRVGRRWLALSAWLRQRSLVHRCLPLLLPGVRRRRDDPDTIVVAPEYAAVLRRELLHLLGYRLVRWSHTPHLSPWRRALRGLAGLGHAVVGMLRYAARGGERAALPAERETDWIARRHQLDIKPPGTRTERNAP